AALCLPLCPVGPLIIPQRTRRDNATSGAEVGGTPLLVAPLLDPDAGGAGEGGGDDGVGSVAGADGVDGRGGVVPGGRLDVVEAELARRSLHQLAHVDAEQPDTRSGVDLLEEALGGPHDLGAAVDR